MDWGLNFFFASRQNVFRAYGKLFGTAEEDDTEEEYLQEQDTETQEVVEAPTQITGRYYWHNMMTLTNRDLTKLEDILNMPLSLCLNFLADAKDIYEKILLLAQM